MPEAAQVWSQHLGKDLVEKAFSAEWGDREGALREISDKLSGPKPIAGRNQWGGYLGILDVAAKDKVRAISLRPG